MKKTNTTTTGKEVIDAVDILAVHKGWVDAYLVSKTAYLHNRLSEKAKRELLMPKGRKTAFEKATVLKHDPMAEFAASPHRINVDTAPTLVGIPAAAFKGAMMTAALDLPGTKKAQIGRLVWVAGNLVPVYGIPQFSMMPVRSADMARTPDIRTRAIMPEWAAKIRIEFVEPLMRAQAVLRLLVAAGLYIGVGDGRNEKGKLNFGAFEVVDPDDERFARIVKTGGRAAQIEAMRAPADYDEETAELHTWYDTELATRRTKGAA